MPDVFISYKREDHVKAAALANALSARGLDVWWDTNLLPGDRFSRDIRAHLMAARTAIVLWSQRSVESAFVVDEAGIARADGKLLPVLIDDCEVPLGFGQLHTLDLRQWDGDPNSGLLRSLFSAIDSRLGRVAAGQTEDSATGVSTSGIRAADLFRRKPGQILGTSIVGTAVLSVFVWAMSRGPNRDLPDSLVTTDSKPAALLPATTATPAGKSQAAESPATTVALKPTSAGGRAVADPNAQPATTSTSDNVSGDSLKPPGPAENQTTTQPAPENSQRAPLSISELEVELIHAVEVSSQLSTLLGQLKKQGVRISDVSRQIIPRSQANKVIYPEKYGQVAEWLRRSVKDGTGFDLTLQPTTDSGGAATPVIRIVIAPSSN